MCRCHKDKWCRAAGPGRHKERSESPDIPGTEHVPSLLGNTCLITNLHARCPVTWGQGARLPSNLFPGELDSLLVCRLTSDVLSWGSESSCKLTGVWQSSFPQLSNGGPCFLAAYRPGGILSPPPATSRSQNSCLLSSRRAARLCHLPSSAF